MKNLGIIAEYNPFHNGHKLHLEKSKQLTGCENTIVVMGGNFTQRGDTAIIDKYCRTYMALSQGADLVLELPIYYATSSAEYFARGAISILNATGIVDCLSFGSESGNIRELTNLAEILTNENAEYLQNLNKNLDTGMSFPMARQLAVSAIIQNADVLNSPNNILAIEYLKAIIKLNSNIKPYTFGREIAPFHSTKIQEISSATAIRKAVLNCNEFESAMPLKCYEVFKEQIKLGKISTGLECLKPVFEYILLEKNADYIREIMDVSEGLENRIINSYNPNKSIEENAAFIKSKRYTLTRINRIFLHVLLEMKQNDFDDFEFAGGVQYIRILGFRKSKEFLLNELEKNCSLPLIVNLKSSEKKLSRLGRLMLSKELTSTDIYNMTCKNPDNFKNYENKQPLVKF